MLSSHTHPVLVNFSVGLCFVLFPFLMDCLFLSLFAAAIIVLAGLFSSTYKSMVWLIIYQKDAFI